MRIFLAILVAAACGVGIGAGSAALRIHQNPWKGGFGAPPAPTGGSVSLTEDEYNFGKMDAHENGKHEFTITNRGDRKLTLNPGSSSCSCTVSEIKDSEVEPWHRPRYWFRGNRRASLAPFIRK